MIYHIFTGLFVCRLLVKWSHKDAHFPLFFPLLFFFLVLAVSMINILFYSVAHARHTHVYPTPSYRGYPTHYFCRYGTSAFSNGLSGRKPKLYSPLSTTATTTTAIPTTAIPTTGPTGSTTNHPNKIAADELFFSLPYRSNQFLICSLPSPQTKPYCLGNTRPFKLPATPKFYPPVGETKS